MRNSYLAIGLAFACALVFAVNPALAASPDMAAAAHPVLSGLAMSMAGIAAAPRVRGILGVRAEANGAEIAANLNRAWDAFKVENDARLKGLEKKVEDVIQNEKVDRIGADITKLQAAMDEQAKRMASLSMAEGAGIATPERRAHAQAFNRFLRKGIEADLRDLEVQAALRTNSDPDGGYVVTPEIDTAISRVEGIYSSMRSLARVVQVGGAVFKKLHNVGGASSGWVGETEDRTETNTPSLKELSFETMEVYAKPYATQAMLDDASMDVEAWLAEEVAIEFAEEEGGAFISGSGVARPRGFLSYTTIANASYEWGKVGFVVTGGAASFASSDPADALITLQHALKRGYRANGTWLMNDATLAAVRKFKSADTDQYLWQPGLQAGMPSTILGKPVETDDNMPDLGSNAFPVAFGDFRRGYIITDRMGARTLRDPFTAKPYVQFYTTKRVGGGIADFAAIKLLKCST